MRKTLFVSLTILLLASPVYAQMGDRDVMVSPLAAGAKATADMVKDYITKAAEQVPEKLYAFRPTADVRTFGQLVGHIADSNYMICAAAVGEQPPVGDIEKTKTSKADLTAALSASYSYCDSVYAGTTDENASELQKFPPTGQDMPRLTLLSFNTAHNFEHYGNIATYMRLNKMVPPSTQAGMR